MNRLRRWRAVVAYNWEHRVVLIAGLVAFIITDAMIDQLLPCSIFRGIKRGFVNLAALFLIILIAMTCVPWVLGNKKTKEVKHG